MTQYEEALESDFEAAQRQIRKLEAKVNSLMKENETLREELKKREGEGPFQHS